jgi:hypothetical protein
MEVFWFVFIHYPSCITPKMGRTKKGTKVVKAAKTAAPAPTDVPSLIGELRVGERSGSLGSAERRPEGLTYGWWLATYGLGRTMSRH